VPGRTRVAVRGLALALALAFTPAARASVDPTTLSIEQLMEIRVVSASKYEQRQRDVAAAVSVITRDEMKAFGWRTLDAALSSLPGVYRTFDRVYSYLGFRGYGLPGDLNTRVLVMIDGNRVNEPNFDQAPLGNEFPLDMDLVERVEFIPGPGGAVYGQHAMFGVVNVVTRQGLAVDGTEVRAAYERRRARTDGRATFGSRLDGGADLLLSVSAMRAGGDDRWLEFPSAGPDGETVAGLAPGSDREHDRELFARVGKGPWHFSLAYSDRRKHDPLASYLTDPLVPGQYLQDRSVLGQLQYESEVAPGLGVLARAFAGRYRFDQAGVYGGVRRDIGARSDWTGGELRAVWTHRPEHTLMLGIEAQRNARTDQFARIAGQETGIFIPESSYRIGAYAQDEWRLGESLQATLGLRIDRDDVTGTHAAPRAGLIWQAGAATSVKALYGRAGRSPNAYERAWDDGVSQVANPSLGAERIDTLELVVDHRAAPDLALRASTYRWAMKDVITLGLAPAEGLTQYQAGQRVRATGLELSAHKTWPWGGRARASVSYQDAGRAGGERLPNSPRVLAKLLFSARLPVAGTRLAYEFRYDGPRRTLQGYDVGGAPVSDLCLGWDLGARTEATLRVANLFHRRYQHPGSAVNWQSALDQEGASVRIELAHAF
jgi:outer membrane receptor protein involved in Fe transport